MLRTHCLRALLTLLLMCALPVPRAQALNPTFAHGVHYSFERFVVTRPVRDAFDQGRIELVSYVYRPLKSDRGETVVLSHGSTGGWTVSPSEPVVPSSPLVKYFVNRGFTVIAPMRRGRGESSGRYVEECEFQAGKCTLAENTALFDKALDQALLDSTAVIRQWVKRTAPRSPKRILFTGESRGGFLSLALAATFPQETMGVINFVGGWLSLSPKWSEEVNAQRMQLHARRLAQVADRVRVPTLWIYGERDSFYSDAVTREFFAAYTAAGGRGEYHLITDPDMKDGHSVAWWPEHWESKADDYLKALGR
jgi:pimeloyl-ACP methyl ester carboxylesterase